MSLFVARCGRWFGSGGLLSLLLGVAAPAAAQDPVPAPFVLRTLRADDGTPMPGVPLHVLPPGHQPAAELRDGWLIPIDRRLHDLAHSRVLWSDPNGELRGAFTGPDGIYGGGVFVGAPFRSRALEQGPDGPVLRCERLEQFLVQARDADGAPLARLPLCLVDLFGDGSTAAVEAVAITDERGLCRFGIDPRTTVRLRVVPWGWVGPVQSFPTVSAALPGRSAQLVVPPFGAVQLRALRGGAPAKVALIAGELSVPVRWRLSRHGFDRADCRGVEYPRVALGVPLRGWLETDTGRHAFAASGPDAAGQTRVVDVETDPPRPQLAFTLSANGRLLTAADGVQVTVGVATDAGQGGYRVEHVDLDANGRGRASFARQRLVGKSLRRVDVHVQWPGPAGRCASVSLVREQPLVPGALDLGQLELAAVPPLLRGRVLDAAGKPVAGARVTAQADPERWAWLQCEAVTEADGSFQVLGPWPRGEDGAPLAIRAFAGIGYDTTRRETPVRGPLPAGSETELVFARHERGDLALQFAAPVSFSGLLAFELHAAGTSTVVLGAERVQWDGSRCVLPSLPVGKVSLRVLLRPGVELLRFDDVQVPIGAEGPDPRLQGIDLTGLLTVHRLRAVDAAGVPLGRVQVTYEGRGSESVLYGSQDRGGWFEVVVGPAPHRVAVGAPGYEPVPLGPVRTGQDVVLHPRHRLRVEVRGLPPFVPRDRVAVQLRPVPRDLLTAMEFAPLGDGDRAMVPRPRPGSYWVRLLLREADRTGKEELLNGETFLQGPNAVVVTEGMAETIEIELDAAALTWLRQRFPQ
jgi:hypothetical protein